MKIDLSAFERNEIEDLPGIFEYRNELLGEYYLLSELKSNRAKKLKEIEFSPPIELESLRCQSTVRSP